MDRSTKTGRATQNLALAVSTALAGIAMAGCMTAYAASPPTSSFDSARTALAKGQVAKAIQHAEAAVLAEPRNPGARALLGAAYLEAGRFQSAATSFGDALDLGDTDPRTVLSFALAKIALGDNRAAVKVLDEHAQTIEPADLGLALALAGEPQRGVGVLVNAVRASEEVSPKLRQNLAYSFALAGNWRAARVMAAEDVPADKVDERLGQWARMAAPEMHQLRIASLLDVTPRADSGQPQQLALANFTSRDTKFAEAAPEAASIGVAVAEPTPAAPIATSVRPPVNTVAQAFATPEPTSRTAALEGPVRYVSNPVVQELPVAASTPARAARVATTSSQRRMAATAARAPTASSDKAAATHLVQLGAYDSKIEAERGWNVLKAKFPMLRDHKPVFTEAMVNGRTFWRVAAQGFGPRSAKAMCSTVKSAGRGCFAYAATTPPAGAVKGAVQMASRSR